MSRRNSLGAQFRAWEAAAAIGAAVAFCGPVFADDIKPPSDPVAKAAFDVLEKHCARCHQEGRLEARERPSKNFGNVLQLQELAESPSRVLPGNPFASKMFKQIIDKEMPYDVIYEGASLPNMTETEIKAIEAWIVSLSDSKGRAIAVEAAPKEAAPEPRPTAEAPPPPEPEPKAAAEAPPPEPRAQQSAAAPPRRPPPEVVAAAQPPAEPACKFVSTKDIIGIIAADLDAMPKSRAKGTRYLTLTHLSSICTKDKFMEVFRQGAIKLVNGLSRSSDVVVLEAIDPSKSILRINIDDLGWDAADWETLVAEYPYGVRPETQLNAVLQGATGTKTAFIRADWFAFKAARPGLYEKLLKLPKTFQGLAKDQGVDLAANIKRFTAVRAGFQKSGVSAHNRLIERHPSKNGYFWTSYDFAGSRRKQSLFEFPLGPGGATGFDHDGGETIFSLPNGFQAYYLNTADGKPLEKGPVDIVRDLDNPRDPSVINGISCMRCHDQGMRKAKDDIREAVFKARTQPKDVRDAVEALYPPHEKMDRVIEEDGRKFLDAMKRAGLNPTLKLNGVEMTFALSRAYEEDLGADQVASELGMPKEEFLSAASDADKKYKTMVRRLKQGTIPRDDFEAVFIELAEEVADMEPIRGAGGAGRPAAKAPSGGGKPVAGGKGGELVLTSDRDSYNIGDTPVFTVVAPSECFLTLTNVDEKGEGTVLFPNKFQQNNKIKGRVELQFPGDKAGFTYRVKDPGVETVIAVCTDKGGEVDGIKHNFTRSVLTSVPDYSSSVARSVANQPVKRAIVIEGDLAAKPGAKPGAKPTPVPAPAKGEAPAVSLRNAIKIEVR